MTEITRLTQHFYDQLPADTAVVADDMRDLLFGHTYRASGPTIRQYLLDDEMAEVTHNPTDEDLLLRARSVCSE